MARRRSTFDNFSPSRGPLVVAVCDPASQLVHKTAPIPADQLRAGLEAEVARWVADGWIVEGDFRHGHAFMHKDGQRLGIGLQAIEPTPAHSSHHFAPVKALEAAEVKPTATVLPFNRKPQ